MPTLSIHVPEAEARSIQSAAKKRGIPLSRFLKEAAEKEAERTHAHFGSWARKNAGMVRSGQGNLSVKEGMGG
jgi:hypothetical protein